MVHFPEFALTALCIQAAVIGFPHSEIDGSSNECFSPSLIAAFHVLHRLEVPRHPPFALSSLTIKFTHEQISLSSILNCNLYYLRLSIYSVVKYLFPTIVENKTLL